MNFPDDLKRAIQIEIATLPVKSMAAATQDLSLRYHDIGKTKRAAFIETHAHRLSYINARMPGTYAANHAVFSEIKIRCADFAPLSLLDLGSGPGTVLWAASQVFETLASATLLEQDAELIALGRKLASHMEAGIAGAANWLQQNLQNATVFPAHDVVTASYILGELDNATIQKLVDAAWQSAGQMLVIIEPGTKRGYATILQVRDQLIAQGAHIIAPCPHALQCSMQADPLTPDDWCHFPARVERSAAHRQAKNASLSYEDEKFSYIVVGKHPVAKAPARIVRHPMQKPGHVILDLCVTQKNQTRNDYTKAGECLQASQKSRLGRSVAKRIIICQ